MDLSEAKAAAEGEGVLFARSKDLLLRAQNAIERSLVEAPIVSTYVRKLVNNSMGQILKVGQAASIWPLHLGIACCAIEMAAMGASRFDAERLGILFWSSPRQCDVLFINGIRCTGLDPIAHIAMSRNLSCRYSAGAGTASARRSG